MLRFANADYLPHVFGNSAETIGRYVSEVTKLADDTREEINENNRRIGDRVLELASDPTVTYVVPRAKAPAPHLNFAPLQNALSRLQESARRYDSAQRDPSKQVATIDAQRALDGALAKVEQAMTRNEGLPRRPWFRHQIYAPGFYTGYGVKTLPAVREAIEQHDWKEADEQIVRVAETIGQIAAQIDRATELLTKERLSMDR